MNYISCLLLIVSFFSIHYCSEEVFENFLKTEITRNGSDVKMSCFTLDVDSKDTTTLTMEWIGPSGVSMGNGSTLYLRNLQSKDHGNYTCRAYIFKNLNLIRREISTKFIADSSEIYEDTDEKKNIQILNLWETQSLDVLCDNSEPKEKTQKFSWIRSDGLSMTEENRLYIDSVVQNRHQGKYFCFIGEQNKSINLTFKTIIVNVKVPNLKIKIMPTESIKLFGIIHRICVGLEFSSSIEKFKFKWINSNNLTVSESKMLQVPINELSILGEYHCIVEHAIEGLVYKVKTIINANIISDQNTEEYRISVVPYPTQFKFHEDLSLQCQLSPDNRNFDFHWYKNNKFIASGKVIYIKKFNVNDTGIYKCIASGISSNSKQLTLEANSYQRVCNFQHYNVELTIGAGPQILLDQGQLKEIHCEINADANYTGSNIKWQFKNHLLTRESFQDLKLSRFDGKLTSILVILEANINNEGQYKCIAGSIEKSVNIVVLPKIGFVYVHPQKIEVIKGDSTEFHCRIDGINNILNQNLKWTFISKNGTKIDLPHSNWKISNPASIHFTSFIRTDNALMEDNGYFVCSVPNGAESKGLLIVRQPKRSIKVIVTPSVVNIHKFQRLEFECYSTDMFGNSVGSPVVRFMNGSDIKSDPRFTVTKIGPSRIRVVAPSGLKISENQLNMTCGVYDKYKLINVNIKVICPQNQKSCINGECINSDKFCNGVNDCKDGSDEDPKHCYECDPVSLPCGSSNITGKFSGDRYNINWACDGENDCKNGFDEKNCPKPDEKCNTQIFTCNDKTKIPHGYVCDKRNDCNENEDEIGCTKPQIVKTSENNIMGTIGSNITMICEAVGYPLPRIAWRYNWGCLQDTQRITVTEIKKNCSKVISILQINNFQKGDDAIYGCEAISSSSRAFGNDFFVTMQS